MRARWAAILLVASWPAVARADEESPAKLFENGRRAFEAKLYEEAAASFERSASLSPHVAALANAAEAWERAGKVVRAARACDRALALSLSPNEREAISKRLERLLANVATLDLRGPEDRALKIADLGAVKAPARIRLAPGKYAPEIVNASGATIATRELELGAGVTRVLDLSEASQPPKPGVVTPGTVTVAPATAPPSRSPPLGSWIAFGVATTAAAVTATFGVMTVQAKDDFEAKRTAETRDDFYRARLVTNVAFVTAGVAAVTGVVLWLVDGRKAKVDTAGMATRFAVSPGGLTIRLP